MHGRCGEQAAPPTVRCTGMKTETHGPDYIQSLDRGLAVIRAFDSEHPRMALSDVARVTGMTRAAARRFLLTLERLGYVQLDGRLFSLRPRVLELGFSFLASLSLPEVARPHMEAFSTSVNESVSLSVLDDTDVVYITRVAARRIMSVNIAVGTRLPAYATSMGRVLLASLPADELEERLHRIELRPLTPRTVRSAAALRRALDAARVQGWAIVDQELEESLRSAAVPIRDRAGAAVAAVNVSMHVGRASVDQLADELLPGLLRTARAIEQDLHALGAGGSALRRQP